MLKHASTIQHKRPVDEMFPSCASSSCRHGMIMQHMKQKLFQVSMLGVQCAGGERRAKRGASRLAAPHICFSVKTCFAAPLLGGSEAQLHASGFCCTPPEIELLWLCTINENSGRAHAALHMPAKCAAACNKSHKGPNHCMAMTVARCGQGWGCVLKFECTNLHACITVSAKCMGQVTREKAAPLGVANRARWTMQTAMTPAACCHECNLLSHGSKATW